LGDASFEAVSEAVAAFPAAGVFDGCRVLLPGDDAVADRLGGECGVGSACPEAAVGVDGAELHTGVLCFHDRVLEQSAVDWGAARGDVDDHEPFGGVGDDGL
jgi:hypothetical protein